MNKLRILGWGESQRRDFESLASVDSIAARVASVDRGALTVLGAHADPLTPLVVPHRAPPGIDAPVAGDWVVLRPAPGVRASPDALAGTWTVVSLLPRTSLFLRKEAGRGSAAQPVAANVDRVLVVTAVGDDLSPGRIERYVTAIAAGGAVPVVVVNKVDRPHDTRAVLEAVASAAPSTEVVLVSALHEDGLSPLLEVVAPPMTVALVGSSGVGKTTILNRLLGGGEHATSEVRAYDDTGRHTTTRRELAVCPSGLLVIDTPGVREIGLFDASAGIASAFPDIVDLIASCRFNDCAHAGEPGCAVGAAIEQGSLPPARFDRYLRLLDEIARNDARAGDRKASAEQKQRWKAVHKQQRDRMKFERKTGLKGW